MCAAIRGRTSPNQTITTIATIHYMPNYSPPLVLPNVLHYRQHGPVIADASLALPGYNEEIRCNYFVFDLTWLNWSFNGTNCAQYAILVLAIMHDVYVMHKCE